MTGRWFHDTLGTPTQGTLLPQLFDVKYLDFETVLWRCAMFDLGVLALRLVLGANTPRSNIARSEEHTSELQSHSDLVCRLLLEKKQCEAYIERSRLVQVR